MSTPAPHRYPLTTQPYDFSSLFASSYRPEATISEPRGEGGKLFNSVVVALSLELVGALLIYGIWKLIHLWL